MKAKTATFTPEAKQRFKIFIFQAYFAAMFARPLHLEDYEAECLLALVGHLNKGEPLAWELRETRISRTKHSGAVAEFRVDESDLIIEREAA